jgi:hypothetical protein
VNEDSALLNLPNEICRGISRSNHMTICGFESAECQRFEAVENMYAQWNRIDCLIMINRT